MTSISAAIIAKLVLGFAWGSSVGRWFERFFGFGLVSMLSATGVALSSWVLLLWMLAP